MANSLFQQRRVRRIDIGADELVDWLRHAGGIRDGYLTWPVIKGIPDGCEVMVASVSGLNPWDVHLLIAHESFSPIEGHCETPRLEGTQSLLRYAVRLTDEQVGVVRLNALPSTIRAPDDCQRHPATPPLLPAMLTTAAFFIGLSLFAMGISTNRPVLVWLSLVPAVAAVAWVLWRRPPAQETTLTR